MNLEKVIRHSLKNGLILELWDRSRAVAGDRWLVVLEARIVIPVNHATLPADLRPRVAEIAAALGKEIVFSQKDERNFIAAKEVPGLLKEMETRALDMAADYFGHPEFAGRFIRRKYLEYREKQRLRQV